MIRCCGRTARMSRAAMAARSRSLSASSPEYGSANEEQLLANAYASSLALAEAHALASIAFPAISTGVYGFPPDRAAQIAVGTIAGHLRASRHLSRVIFCCFSPASVALHEQVLRAARS